MSSDTRCTSRTSTKCKYQLRTKRQPPSRKRCDNRRATKKGNHPTTDIPFAATTRSHQRSSAASRQWLKSLPGRFWRSRFGTRSRFLALCPAEMEKGRLQMHRCLACNHRAEIVVVLRCRRAARYRHKNACVAVGVADHQTILQFVVEEFLWDSKVVFREFQKVVFWYHLIYIRTHCRVERSAAHCAAPRAIQRHFV